ncbi:hypothetical protein A1O7_06684 [Cladophialophora yegresii CBS 114405]|uniref:2'-phosphotransferase n=1 Tax=Cladophialophora yegresii CBS 114405 TaxID=1182544 RepID=W9VU33_9EURO|nr:uncharacterized protein A1O7_06684 [Cladophialophora yegresii CBS 114405]EXJ59252.1 hypothetical protein A1O7_06684 [Cladophialophora yegresii CBS 114405]
MPRGGRGGHGGPQPRSVLVSKALSRLLRHAAVEERIPIDNHGYVRVDHLLAWHRLRSMKPPVSFAEVVEVVQENEKKRFALRFVGPVTKDEVVPPSPPPGDANEQGRDGEPEPETEGQVETTTQHAISRFEATPLSDLDLSRFFIRATQGHSMKTIEAEGLLTPISLDDPASVPDTVVHGTFYGAWEEILRSGGLKSMRRNHVHFASGPSLQEVWPEAAVPVSSVSDAALGEDGSRAPRANGDDGVNDSTSHQDHGINSSSDSNKDNTQPPNQHQNNHTSNHGHSHKNLPDLLGKNKVISGMRHDAQILIYIDIRRALTDEQEMKWWRSENGVILTDGIGIASASSTGSEAAGVAAEKIVPTKYFLAAVEVKEGVGLLYSHGGGVVKELPERLKSRGPPRGKGGGPRGARGRGRGRGADRG